MKQNFIVLIVGLILFSCETVRTGDENLPCSQIKDIGVFENERNLPLEGQSELSFVDALGNVRSIPVNTPTFNQADITEFSTTSHFSDCFRTGDVEQLVWQQEEHLLNYDVELISRMVVREKIVVDSLNPDNGILGEYFEIQSQLLSFNGNISSFSIMAFPINGSNFLMGSKFNFGYDMFEDIIINGRTFPKVFASKNFFISNETSRVFIAPSGELVAFETFNGETYIIDE